MFESATGRDLGDFFPDAFPPDAQDTVAAEPQRINPLFLLAGAGVLIWLYYKK